MARIQVGDTAPDFTLPDSSGGKVSLSDYRDKKVVVLYFYPKDNSSGCTAEACAFRDSHQVFTDAGAEVIGVSVDSIASHEDFANRHQLPFTLLSDADGTVRKEYGVTGTFGVLPGRVTYVIDRQGTVRSVFSSLTKFNKHVSEALDMVRTLQGETQPA
jgi:peroxiredoxin Q/BCP